MVTICTAHWSLCIPHSGHYMYRTVVTICTAHWSLYIPHSGHYIYRTVVAICTTILTLTNSTFCPHTVFMCFMWISEQTAVISLCSINWLVCIAETESVYCAVRNSFFNKAVCVSSVKGSLSRDVNVSGGVGGWWDGACPLTLATSDKEKRGFKLMVPLNVFTTVRCTDPAACENERSVHCTEDGIEGLRITGCPVIEQWFFRACARLLPRGMQPYSLCLHPARRVPSSSLSYLHVLHFSVVTLDSRLEICPCLTSADWVNSCFSSVHPGKCPNSPFNRPRPLLQSPFKCILHIVACYVAADNEHEMATVPRHCLAIGVLRGVCRYWGKWPLTPLHILKFNIFLQFWITVVAQSSCRGHEGMREWRYGFTHS